MFFIIKPTNAHHIQLYGFNKSLHHMIKV